MDVVQGWERFTTLSLFMYTYVCKHVKYVKTHRVESKHPPISTRLVTWDDTPIACFADACQIVLLVKLPTTKFLWRSWIHLLYTQDNLRCIDCDRRSSDCLSRTPNTASATFQTLHDVGLCTYCTFCNATWAASACKGWYPHSPGTCSSAAGARRTRLRGLPECD